MIQELLLKEFKIALFGTDYLEEPYMCIEKQNTLYMFFCYFNKNV